MQIQTAMAETILERKTEVLVNWFGDMSEKHRSVMKWDYNGYDETHSHTHGRSHFGLSRGGYPHSVFFAEEKCTWLFL